MNSLPPKRILLPALLVALVAMLVAEGFAAFTGEGAPEAPGSPDEVVGPDAGAPLLFVVLGDSTGSGVGAVTQDSGYPRRCATALARRTGRRVELRDFAVSGARVADVLNDQLKRMAGLRPDLVLLVIGGNDATHLTSPIAVRADLRRVRLREGAPLAVPGTGLRRRQRRIDFLDPPPLRVDDDAALVDGVRGHLIAVVDHALVVGPFVHAGSGRGNRAQREPCRETRGGALSQLSFVDR